MSTLSHDPLRTSGGPTDAGLPKMTIHTVLIAVRCWWHIALPLGVLLAAAAMVVVYYTFTPRYTAQAWVMIRTRAPIIVRDISPDDPQKFVQNQVELIRSPMVLDPVASDPGVASTPELADELDPVQYLRSNLRIRSQGGSDYYVIEFTSKSPEKAALIVNKVSEEYRALQDRHEKLLNHLTIRKLQEQRTAKEEAVKLLRSRLEVLSKEVLGTPAFGVQTAEESKPTNTILTSLRAQLLALDLEQATTSAKLDAANELFKLAEASAKGFEPAQVQIEAQVQSLPQVKEMKRLMDEDKGKLREHKEKSVDPKRNPLIPHFEKRVQDGEAALAKSLEELRAAARADLVKYGRELREAEIRELENQLRDLGVRTQVIKTRLKDERGEQRTAAGNALEYDLARSDYDRTSALMEAISQRIETMQTEQGAPARVQIERPAPVPSRPDEAVPYKKMGLAAAAAMCVPFALAVGIELLFRRVSSRQQLELAGQISVVAEVTALPSRVKSNRRQAICRDRQLFEESIDGLRTYLSLVESMRGRKVLAVTSAISREGKTSLASQLAVSVASATGRPTLLVDGDLRSPDIHRIFDVERGPGLSEVLQGELPVEEAIETGFSNNLHLLTAGDLQISPHRILGNNKFPELVAKLGQMYHQIIIDTPPVLAASEALLMASAADAAILCVRRDFSRVDQVADAFGRLRSAGVRTAGAVLNGIPARHYAYRYGSYYYNRDRAPEAAAPGVEEPA